MSQERTLPTSTSYRRMGKTMIMRVDGKIIIRDREDYDQLTNMWEPYRKREWVYNDTFFDAPDFRLMNNYEQLRLRVPVKGQQGKPPEVEDEHSAFLSRPTLTLKSGSLVESGNQAASNLRLFLSQDIVDSLLPEGSGLTISRSATRDDEKHFEEISQRLKKHLVGDESEFLMAPFISYKTVRTLYSFPPSSETNGTAASQGDAFQMRAATLGARIYVDKTTVLGYDFFEVEVQDVSGPVSDVVKDVQNFFSKKRIKCSLSLSSKLDRCLSIVMLLEREDLPREIRVKLMCSAAFEEVRNWLENDQDDGSNRGVSSGPLNENGQHHLTSGGGPTKEASPGRHIVRSSPAASASAASQALAISLSQSDRQKRRREKYQIDDVFCENYFFDDAKDGTLKKNGYVLRLRCSNPYTEYSLELRGNTRQRLNVSGDIARLLLRDGRAFMDSLPSKSGLAILLRGELRLKDLKVVAVSRSRRLTCNGPRFISEIIKKDRVDDASGLTGGDRRDSNRTPLPSGVLAPILESGVGITIQVSHTEVLTGIDPAEFARKVSETDTCSMYCRGDKSFIGDTSVKDLCEVKVLGLPDELIEAGRRWLDGKLKKLGMEFQAYTHHDSHGFQLTQTMPQLQGESAMA
uniref:Uncharacterized protein TCIL3000_10_13120 n=1 Tax=Trypanosoma congolense (strain IL3000) TaxID=1068625 RepID=G0UYR2_TRYCI|nr:unnamed protein product [Trypanosoma congolense IL3000]